MIAGMVTPDGDEDIEEDEAKQVKEMINRTDDRPGARGRHPGHQPPAEVPGLDR
jgi:hypothetical protein